MAGRKKTRVEVVMALAMELGQKHLAPYGAVRSRKDFTQRQLMSCLILRAYLQTTYRGVLEMLTVSAPLRAALGLEEEKLPHYTTLQKFSARPEVLAVVDTLLRALVEKMGPPPGTPAAAMDSTGLEVTGASAYFNTRRGQPGRKWVKLSLVVWCTTLLPLALHVGWGPSNDKVQAPELLAKARQVAVVPERFYADAGYDADWVHRFCHQDWGTTSIIKPAHRCRDGTLGGTYRAAMSPEHLQSNRYGLRWHIESFMSALKRTTGCALRARLPRTLFAEAALRVLAYSLRR
jgi:hypothetical protein